jgi:hypothetical protein
MSVDIVERLNRHRCVTGIRTVIDEAADEIQRLRNALQAIADNKHDEPYAADFARDILGGKDA